MMPVTGQGSGDFMETWSRVIAFHIANRVGSGMLVAPDAATQRNPKIVTDPAAVSRKLQGISKRGILGSMVAFTRPDAGNGYIGGPVLSPGYLANIRPLGIFINDYLGNPYENAPGVASNRLAYHSAGTYGIRLWETQVQVTADGATVGDDLVYTTGDALYASVNGLMTNRFQDAYQYQVPGQDDIGFCTFMGTVLQAPDGSWNEMLVFDNPY
jgi:hypothetical protein